MSNAPEATYFRLRTNMSRQNCSCLLEYFRLDGETGKLESVSVYEDGLAYHTPPAPFRVPVRAEASTAAAYAKALTKAAACEKKRKEVAKIEKELRKRVDAMRRALGTPLPVERHAELVEASLLLPEPELVNVDEQPAKLVSAAVEASLPHTQLLDDFTVIDTEFVPEGPHLLEVAAIRYINMEPREAFVSFVAFGGRVPSFITELTGITALHLHGAPSEKTVLGLLRQYAGDSLLVCHNVPADRGIIEKVRTRLGAAKPLENTWLCTMAMARKRLPKKTPCGLKELCQQFKIQSRGAHRAKADVLMTVQLLRKLHELQHVTKFDLYGAVQPGKSRKSTPAGPGLLFEAAA